MHMENTVRKLLDKSHRVHHLPEKMAGIEVESELLAVIQRFKGALRGHDIKSDFRGVHLKSEFHAVVLEDVKDRMPHLRKEIESVVDGLLRHRREAVKHVPDRRTGKAGHDFDPQIFRRLRGVFHLFDCPCALFIHLAGKFLRCKNIRPEIIVGVADKLSGEMIADGIKIQIVDFKRIQKLFTVFLAFRRLHRVKVGSTRYFDSFIAP